jgi:hypothetical protein
VARTLLANLVSYARLTSRPSAKLRWRQVITLSSPKPWMRSACVTPKPPMH